MHGVTALRTMKTNSNQRLGPNPTWEEIRELIRTCINESATSCWEWQRSLDKHGYGRLHRSMAHRLSYEAFIGPIGKGLDIDHLCRNPRCVNPAHLEPVTRRENLARGVGVSQRKKRALERTHCSKGHLLTPSNTYVRPSDGIRQCRQCRKECDQKQRSKNRIAINEYKRIWRKQWLERGLRK